jgi:hypothetical protein
MHLDINMQVTTNDDVARCLSCGMSKDPSRPDFAHVRLGLDEAPEPQLCKCKSDIEIMDGMALRYGRVQKYIGTSTRTSITKIGSVNLNAAVVRYMSRNLSVEVEARFTSYIATRMHACMSRGMFGDTVESAPSGTGPYTRSTTR